MNKNNAGALDSMMTLFKFYGEDKKTFKRYELSESVLFVCRIYDKMGQHKEALEFLEKHKADVVDSVKKEEYFGHFNLLIGNKEKAIVHYEDLLMLNSANLDTYLLLLKAKGINIPTDTNEQLSNDE